MNASFGGWWQQLSSRLSSRWGSLSGRQRRNLAIAAAALIACIAVSAWLLSRPHYVTIMSGLDDKSLGEVQSKLEDLKIPFEISGSSVLVPQREADEARIQLATAGLPDTGYIGYSSVSNSFGMTEDQFNIQVLDALQQSLNHTIESIDGVESAQVHIVMPQEQVFVSQPQDTAKASVFVQLGTGVQLSSAQVAGIQQLVAHSVKGLSASNVTVVDQNGVDLSSNSASTTSVTAGTELAQRQELEQDLQQRLTSGLEQIVGPGNAVVVVHANVTFDRVQSKSHVVQPVPGQDTGLPSSQQVIHKSDNSQGNGVGGVAGQSSTNPGLPTYAGNGTGNSTSQSTDDETNTTYDNSYTDTTTVRDPVQINGYDVGVMLNSASANLTPAVMRQVQQFVKNAVGASTGANAQNSVSVMKVPFQTQATTPAPAAWRWWWVAALAAALLLAGGLWLWWRRRQNEEEAELEPVGLPAGEESLPESLTEDEQIKRQLARLAQQRPEEFANLIRTWLVSD